MYLDELFSISRVCFKCFLQLFQINLWAWNSVNTNFWLSSSFNFCNCSSWTICDILLVITSKLVFYAVLPIINGLSFPSLSKVISIGSWNKDELFASGILLILYSVGQNLYSNDNSNDPPRFFLIFLLSRLNKNSIHLSKKL